MTRTGRSHETAEGLDFRQLGFSVSFTVSADATGGSIRLLLESFRYEVLAPHSLECGGGFDGERFQGFVTQWKASASESDRREVSDWLRRRGEVAGYEIGKLVEAWYGI